MMDPKEQDALEHITKAMDCIQIKDFSNARHLLNQAEEILPTQKAKDLLIFINNQLDSQLSMKRKTAYVLNQNSWGFSLLNREYGF